MTIARRVLLAPSVLSADFANLSSELGRVAGADWIHLDVMDGRFVPNISFGAPVVRSLRPVSKLPFDVHLMVERPERYLEDFANAGATSVTIHVEATPHVHRAVQSVKEYGCRAGVALNPATPLAFVEPVLDDVDIVLVMTVNPGFGGQAFIPSSLPKIAALRRMIDGRGAGALIEVDGGINAETAADVVAAGADVLVAGAAIFGADDPGRALDGLRRSAAQNLFT